MSDERCELTELYVTDCAHCVGADPIEDLRKMVWYGQRELERLTKDA